ncbi:MAG: glycosyltransferase family 9 protein [Blastocatellales bacterium]|nr:glycosyltransferase family 9 protein [Blastocatellales bacterium]
MAKTETSRTPQSFLVVRLGAIGDVIHTLPAVSLLRRHFPQARIGWVAEKGAAVQILKAVPILDHVIVLDLRGMRRSLLRNLEEINQVRREISDYEVALDFQGLLKSGAIPWLGGIRRRIGFDYGALRERAAGIFYTERVSANDTLHVIEKNLALLYNLGCSSNGHYNFPLNLSPEAVQFAQRAEESADGKFAILNPGGGWPTKLWPARNFGLLADLMKQRLGMTSLVTYGPKEAELAFDVCASSTTGAAVAVESDLVEFAALVRRAEVFIGGDTGPMHIAAAAGTPVVSIFGPTSAKRNGPFSPQDVVVERTDLECRVDCYRRRCDHCSCMQIGVEAVWEAICRRLRIEDY